MADKPTSPSDIRPSDENATGRDELSISIEDRIGQPLVQRIAFVDRATSLLCVFLEEVAKEPPGHSKHLAGQVLIAELVRDDVRDRLNDSRYCGLWGTEAQRQHMKRWDDVFEEEKSLFKEARELNTLTHADAERYYGNWTDADVERFFGVRPLGVCSISFDVLDLIKDDRELRRVLRRSSAIEVRTISLPPLEHLFGLFTPRAIASNTESVAVVAAWYDLFLRDVEAYFDLEWDRDVASHFGHQLDGESPGPARCGYEFDSYRSELLGVWERIIRREEDHSLHPDRLIQFPHLVDEEISRAYELAKRESSSEKRNKPNDLKRSKRIPPHIARLFPSLTQPVAEVPSGEQPRGKEPPPEVSHSPDFRSLKWGSEKYSFTANQAAVIQVLYEAWEAGSPDVGRTTLLNAIDHAAPPGRVYDVFRNSPAWQTLVVTGSTKGTHRLAEPKEF